MKNGKHDQQSEEAGASFIRVWDLPTRLFHWVLVVLVSVSYATAAIGGNAMQYHEWSGVSILTLLLFRLIWGFAGGRSSRFSSFVRGPSSVVRYAGALFRGDTQSYLSHNPLGGWSVLAMLAALFVQAGTGMFANDEIMTQGPLFSLVSDQTSSRLTGIHLFNQEIIIFLVALHVCAIAFYLAFKREDLVAPMITGVKPWTGRPAEPVADHNWRATAAAALAAAFVYLLVRAASL